MGKHFTLLFLSIWYCLVGFGQSFDRDLIRQKAAEAANRAFVKISEATQCPLFSKGMSEALAMFDGNAMIEVSSLRTRKKRRYPPEDYLDAFNLLHCGGDPLYSKMQILYDPVTAASVSAVLPDEERHDCRATVRVRQVFQATMRKGGRSVCDVTIKVVNLRFFNVGGVLQWKIMGIKAETPQKCK